MVAYTAQVVGAVSLAHECITPRRAASLPHLRCCRLIVDPEADDRLPATALPGADHGLLDVGKRQGVGKAGCALFAVYDGLEKCIRLDGLEVFVAQADPVARIEATVKWVGRPAEQARKAVARRCTVGQV